MLKGLGAGLMTLMIVISVGASENQTPFPLGSLPAGWTYQLISPAMRQAERLPFEVMGLLQRNLGNGKSVSIYVCLKPVERVGLRAPASSWQWVDSVFVRSLPQILETDLQKNIGPKQAWTFREAKILRAGEATHLASFHAKNNYHHVYLVLPEDRRDYQIRLGQLKDLVGDMRLD